MSDGKNIIESGETTLGIELGSTRIKGVLMDYRGNILAVGNHDWENMFQDGIWTYSLDDICTGIRDCYSSLRESVNERYGVKLRTTGAIGISAMMHGYLALDKQGNLLAPFQTWRNTNTQTAADELTELFHFNIPLRWTIAHLYERILEREEYLMQLDYVTTLAGYIHRKLTGRKVTGIGDASGIFPIDSKTLGYDSEMMGKFNRLISKYNYPWEIPDVLPEVLTAGKHAGYLTEEGAAFLDKTGNLRPGIPLCPPEGDAGTGMVATNSVAPRTGNVSAGTSTFAMIVLEHPLEKLHREIDLVTTPSGFPVAMSHANNGTSDLNAWVGIFREFTELLGIKADVETLFSRLYGYSLKGDSDCGGLLAYGYYSGENITMPCGGRPAFLRTADSRFNLANFMRVNLYTSLGAVKMGLDILIKDEKIRIDRILGHGGFFRTREVGQRYLAAAVNAPVTVMDMAGEGGAWGIAVLASYLINKGEGEKLEDYLEKCVFANQVGVTVEPDQKEVEGFEKFMERYKAGLSIEKTAIEVIDW